MNIEDDLADQYRRKHFAVKVESFLGEIVLSVTPNGYQWQSIGLRVREIQRVIDALKPHAKKGMEP